MSGINGIYLFGQGNIDESPIDKMNNSIAHRGVGKSKTLVYHNIGIAQIGQGSTLVQSIDGRYTAVWDGYISNNNELRNILKEYNFHSDSVGETLIAAYVNWVEEMCQYLEGAFAFAILDKKEYQLFVARDRYASIPLYYYLDETIFVFSSEIKALIASGLFKPVFAKDRLPEFFRFGTIMEENTFLRNVKNFPPANAALFSNFLFSFDPYWHVETIGQCDDSYDTAKKNIHKLIVESVSTRFNSDGSTGIFLSGGIDSTIITAAARETVSGEIRTFNISFDEEEFSEAYYAKIVSKKFSTRHEEIKLKPQIFLEEIDNILDSYSFPSMDGANTYIISQAAKRAGINIGLSGLGGDELFCGYPVFGELMPTYKRLKLIPKFAKKTLLSYLNKTPNVRNKKIMDLISLTNPDKASVYGIFRSLMSIEDCKRLAGGYRTVINPQKHFLGKTNFLSELTLAEFDYYMQPVLLRDTEQMSVIHSLEVHAPMLDNQLVDYILSLPDSYKTKTAKPKSLLVESFSDMLPMEVVNRKKMGFVLPWSKWMANELAPLVKKAMKDAEEKDFLNIKNWEIAFEDFRNGKQNYNWNIFWGLIVLTSWMEKNGL
ncbi:MAG: asparagine synthase (glutamine-hydrolyzing) [Bacteroidetes bacterium]|nr:asparagine synthase (glutamine-hydrolyzing) [Bacteroidota bacterium]